jgi:hypothetical protein
MRQDAERLYELEKKLLEARLLIYLSQCNKYSEIDNKCTDQGKETVEAAT